MRLTLNFFSSYQVTIIVFQLLSLSRLGSAFRPSAVRAASILVFRSNSLTSTRAPLRLLSSATDGTEASPEDLARWEQVYYEGSAGNYESSMASAISSEYTTQSEIRVVTFDLDNTIWRTDACIDAANNALAEHLDADNIQYPTRVETIMGDLFKSDKSKYCPLDHENAKAPVLLTQLRTDAIRKILEEHNSYSADDAKAYAESTFQVWTKARHDAISQNLATQVVSCLEKVSSIRTSLGHPVLVGAITDGNSDPRRVEELRDYFDFCVNAEDIGVGKPDKRVYMEAIKQVVSHPFFQDLEIDNVENEEVLENSVGPYWVHIGDDFVKDIVAAKSLRMRSIWATEFVRDKLQKQQVATSMEEGGKRDVKDLVKEIADKKVVEMTIGASNYLADSFTREFVDAVAEEFHHLGDILWSWHQEGTASIVKQNQRDKNKLSKFSEEEPELAAALQDAEKISRKISSEKSDTNKSARADQEDKFISLVNPDQYTTAKADLDDTTSSDGREKTFILPRTFRLLREDCSMDVPAPLLDRQTRTMKDVMSFAQMDKSSGVFAFPANDVEALREGKLVLMVGISGTDLQFSREIFVGMTVQEVLSLTDENPIALSLYMKKAADSPSFDLF